MVAVTELGLVRVDGMKVREPRMTIDVGCRSQRGSMGAGRTALRRDMEYCWGLVNGRCPWDVPGEASSGWGMNEPGGEEAPWRSTFVGHSQSRGLGGVSQGCVEARAAAWGTAEAGLSPVLKRPHL